MATLVCEPLITGTVMNPLRAVCSTTYISTERVGTRRRSRWLAWLGRTFVGFARKVRHRLEVSTPRGDAQALALRHLAPFPEIDHVSMVLYDFAEKRIEPARW